MTPKDSDDPTSPSSSDSESGDDWEDGNTPLTDTVDQDRVNKIDSIMQSFCAALDSKLVLVKKKKPSAIKTEETVQLKEEQDEEEEKEKKGKDIEEDSREKEEKKAESGQASQIPTKAFKGLSLLPKFGLMKKSVAVTPAAQTAPAGPSDKASTFSSAPRPRAAIRLARRASPAAPESAPTDPSPAPPPPQAPRPSQAPAPAPPSPVPAPTPISPSVPGPTTTRALPTAPAPPPPPQITQFSSGGGGGGGGPAPHALPTILPSNVHLLHNQFIHLPSVPPVSSPAFASPPSRSPPGFGGFGSAAQHLQQTGSRPSTQLLGGSQGLRARLSPHTNPPSVGRFLSSSRSLAPHELDHGEPSFGAGPPPPPQWNATGLVHQGAFGGPQVASRSLDQEGLLSPPNFAEPFHSPPNPAFEGFGGESLQPPGAATPGELYPFPAPELGGSRRQYQFGASPDLGEHDSPDYHSRKSSAVSPFAGLSSSPAAVQPALDKAPDRDGRRKRQKATDVNTPKNGEKKFACPYYKRNRKKYCKWTSCPGPGWEEVHRVK